MIKSLGALVLALGLLAGAAAPLAAQPQSQPAAAAPAAAASTTWKVDNVHSHVTFSISHFGLSTQEGRFNDISGTIDFDPENLAASKIQIKVDVKSIDTKHEGRDNHLRNPDYFNTDANPTAEFISTKIEKGDADKTYKVTGDLHFMGQKKPLTTTFVWKGVAKDPRGGERTGADATFVINRPEWGVGKAGGGLGDDATVRVSIEATK